MIPKKLLKEILEDPFYRHCIFEDENAPNHDCHGRITFEHAFIYKNQIQEKWAIVPVCWHHHLGLGLIKDYNQYRAIIRADIKDLQKRMPKKDWQQIDKYLRNKYDS